MFFCVFESQKLENVAITILMILFFTIAAALQTTRHRRMEKMAPQAVPSFDQAYEEHFAFAWRTVRALGVPPGNIDDAVQEVFIVVHRRLPDYQPTASIRSWIFGIVRRVAKDFRRADQRRGPQVSMDEGQLGANTADPYVAATRSEALQIVESFADTLDDERRAIFVLTELEQMPVTEVASALNLNLNTVYSRLKVIKQSLTKFVAAHLGDGGGDFYE